MGSNISAILAILFMDRLETIALSSHLSISPYKRYVDDIYLQTTCEDKADQFHSTMNNLRPKLKFEIEKPEITPNLVQQLQPTLHREHHTLYPRSCERTPEQW